MSDNGRPPDGALSLKVCARCGTAYPREGGPWAKHPTTADRTHPWCLACRREYRRSRPRHASVDVADLIPPPVTEPGPEPAAPETEPAEGPVAREPVPTPADPDPAEVLVPAPTLARLAAILQAGAMLDDAARACDLDPAEVVTWLARGDGHDAEPSYAAFRARVLSASSTADVRLAAIVSKAAESDWKAAAWLLEHGAGSSRWARETSTRAVEAPGPPDPGDPFAEVDQLAARRARQGPGADRRPPT